MKTKLPKTLYIRREADGKESYLVAFETTREHCDLEEVRIVGEYRLVKPLKVKVTAEVVAIT